MSEHPTDDPRTKVARDLSAITDLDATLESQAIAKATDRLMPGGRAMVALAPDADPEEWAENIAAVELYHYATCERTEHKKCRIAGAEHLADHDDEWEPPLQTLLFWSEAWREQHGYPMPKRPTITTEANFIRWALEWAWSNEPRWEDFARDVNAARRRLEDVLYAGRRAERTRVPCSSATCEKKSRLIKVYAATAAGDFWKCPSCKHRYDRDEFRRAQGLQMRSEGAQRFVSVQDAVGTLRAQGRAERTIRKWLGPAIEHIEDRCAECGRRWPPQEYAVCPSVVVDLANSGERQPCGGELSPVRRGDPEAVIEGYCLIKTRQVFVWWPTLWRLHLMTKTRERRAS